MFQEPRTSILSYSSAFDMLLFATSAERMGILFGADNAPWTVGTVSNWVVASGSIFTSYFCYVTDD